MRRLEVAQNASEINEGFDLLISQQVPGFQIDPKVDLELAKLTLEARMGEYIAGFALNEHITSVQRKFDDERHVDPIATYRRGIALHENGGAVGKVDLTLIKPHEAYYTDYGAPTIEMITRSIRASKKYVGSLEIGTKTVFSEGIRSPLLEEEIGPTAHLFRPKIPGTRHFTRYTWSGVRSKLQELAEIQ